MADQFFDELNRFAAQLVGDAQSMTQENAPPDSATEAQPSIAVGEPAPSGEPAADGTQEVVSEVAGSTPLVLWSQPRRYFQGLADDASQLVREAQQTAPVQEPTPTPSPSAPPQMAINRRQVFIIQAPVASSGTVPVQSRRAVAAAAAPSSAPRPIYAVGAYFVPENPILPINDYWRQWDQLDRAQAEAKVQELTNLGIPSYYYDGNSWVPLYRYA